MAGSSTSRRSTVTHRWEAAASLLLRSGDLRGLDAYEAHGRIIAGSLDEHLGRIATAWIDRHARGESTAMVASTNDHVDAINTAVQAARLDVGQLDPGVAAAIAGGERAHPGDVIATRRNHRRLITTAGSRSATASSGPSPQVTPTAR